MMNPKKISITESLEVLASNSKSDVSVMLGKLRIPESMASEDLVVLKNKLQGVSGGDRSEIENFAREISVSLRGSIDTPAGGVNKLEYHWWGYQLFISHGVLEKIDSGMEWVDAVAFVASACGAPFEVIDVILGALSIDLLLLNTFVDKGNGVQLNYPWVPAATVVPLPQ